MPRKPHRTGAALVLAAVTCFGSVVWPGAGAATALGPSITCDPVTGTPVTHAPAGSYTAIQPERLIDTREAGSGVGGPVGAGCTLAIDLGPAVPSDATAVALSVTAISEQRGFLTVFACDEGQPATSNLNTRASFPTPNLVIAAVGASRRICVYSKLGADVVIDLTGWWSDGPNRFLPMTPVRAYDTRELPGEARLPGFEVRSIPLAGQLVPIDASAATVNLTVIGAASPGFLVAFPCGSAPPLASNLNFRADEARAVSAIVGLGPDGDICVMSNVDVHVIVDVSGAFVPRPAFGPSASLQPIVGHRVVDTREATGQWTTPLSAGEVRRLNPLAGTAFAGHASAVALNVVALDIAGPGYVALFPCGSAPPLVSSLNLSPGTEATNLVTVDLDRSGHVCVLASQHVDLVIDLFAVIGPSAGSLAEQLDFGGRTVFPPYDADGSDYAVVCDSGDTAITMTVEPLADVTVRVNGVAHPPGAVDLLVAADGLVTVDLQRTGEHGQYHFRCVPLDFPVLDVRRPGSPAPGWYLTTVAKGSTHVGAFAVILDERGAPVWFKRTAEEMIDFKRLADGSFAYTPLLGERFGVDPDRGYQIIDIHGDLIAERFTDDPAECPVDHHDYVEVPGGGWSVLCYPLVGNQDLTVLGPGYFADDSIVDGEIREMTPSGDLAWRWSTKDQFGYDEVTFPVRWGLYPSEPHGGEVDVFHLNSLQRLDNGDYVVSGRHLDAIFRVDRATGDVDWILGGAAGVDRPERLTIIGDPLGGPLRPHDARLTGDVLTMLDNRAASPGPARAVAYRIDEQAMTATLLWQIDEPLRRPSAGLGSVRAASDGSVLVAWGALQPAFNEFAADGTMQMSIEIMQGHFAYRIVKYPKATFSVSLLRSTAGGGAEAPPLP